MENKRYSEASSVSVQTITAIQKSAIEEAILCAIKNGIYHDGLEIKACKAISAINKFSDAEIKNELVDNETGERFIKT